MLFFTHCIERVHSLATTSSSACKMSVVSTIKMVGTLLNLSSSKISKEIVKVAKRLEELLKARIMFIKGRI